MGLVAGDIWRQGARLMDARAALSAEPETEQETVNRAERKLVSCLKNIAGS